MKQQHGLQTGKSLLHSMRVVRGYRKPKFSWDQVIMNFFFTNFREVYQVLTFQPFGLNLVSSELNNLSSSSLKQIFQQAKLIQINMKNIRVMYEICFEVNNKDLEETVTKNTSFNQTLTSMSFCSQKLLQLLFLASLPGFRINERREVLKTETF